MSLFVSWEHSPPRFGEDVQCMHIAIAIAAGLGYALVHFKTKDSRIMNEHFAHLHLCISIVQGVYVDVCVLSLLNSIAQL